MGNSKFIGRVGALAVALGIGGAMTNGAGVAWATPDDSSPKTEQSSTPADGPKPSTAKTHTPHPLHDIVARVREAVEGLTKVPAGHPTTTTGPSKSDGPKGDGPTDDNPTVVRSNGDDVSGKSNRTVVTQRDKPRLTTPRSVRRVEANLDRGADAVTKVVRDVADAVTPRPAADPGPAAPQLKSQTQVVAKVVDSPIESKAVVASTPAPPSTVRVGLVPRLLSVLDITTPNRAPSAPPENPILAAVLGFVRRLEYTFDNRAPSTHFRSDEVVQTTSRTAVGYLDPIDREGDKLTYSSTTAKGGTVAFDQNTPGKFTYTAPTTWNGTGEWTDTVKITTSDEQSGFHLHGLFGFLKPGAGHTTTQIVNIDLKQPATTTVDDNGVATGRVFNDNATIGYTVSDTYDKTLGSVTVDANGKWTYTPSPSARLSGPTSLTFNLIANDPNGHLTPISITAPVTRASVVSVPSPPGAEPTGPLVAGPDGSVVRTSHDEANNKTYVTVIGTDGVPHVSAPLPGAPVGNTAVAAGGKTYQATFDANTNTTYVNLVRPDGTVTTTQLAGELTGDIVLGPGGSAYVTSVVTPAPAPNMFRAAAFGLRAAAAPAATSDDGVTTHLTYIGANGTVYDVGPLPGRPWQDVKVDPNGTAYVQTFSTDQQTGDNTTYVTAVTTDGSWHTSDPMAGSPGTLTVRPGIDAVATAYDRNTNLSTLYTVKPDGTTVGYTLPGAESSDPTVTGDGTVYVATQTYDQGQFHAAVSRLNAQGVLQSYDLPGGGVASTLGLGADGKVYVASTDFDQNLSYVTVFDSSGPLTDAAHTPVIPGELQNDLIKGPDGRFYVTTTASSGPNQDVSYIAAVSADGSVAVSAPLTGVFYDPPTIAPDGTVYQVVVAPGQNNRKLAIIGADGATQYVTLPGIVTGPGVLDSHGVYYQPTADPATITYHVVPVYRDGTIKPAMALPGFPISGDLVVAPDGTVYSTTVRRDTGLTYVSALAPDGSVRISGPLTGEATDPAVIGANGTIYQTVGGDTFALNASSFTLHRPPTPVGTGFTAGSPASGNGAVTGSVNVTDPDGSPLTYSLAPGADSGVTLNADGTFTFVPSDPQRNAAFYGTGPTEQTFTVYVSDGDFNVPIVVKAPISGARGTTVALPPGATPAPYGSFAVGSDGTAYQLSNNTATNQSYVTVIGTDGRAYTSGPMPGMVTSETPIAGANGKTYVLTYDDSALYVNAIEPDGTTTHVTVSRIGSTLVAGPNGTVYQTSFVNQGANDESSYVTYVGSDGALHSTAAIPGATQGAVVGPDGRAYLTSTKAGQSYVTVIGRDGVVGSPVALTGKATGTVVFGGDGTAYQSTLTETEDTLYVTAIGADGTAHTSASIAGYVASGLIATPDGVAVSTRTYNFPGQTTHVTVVDNTGAIVRSGDVNGSPSGNPVVDANGAVYQATAIGTGNDYHTVIGVLRPDGIMVYSPDIPGLVHYAPLQMGANGKPFVLTDNRDTGGDETTLTMIDASGATTIVHGIPGLSEGEKNYVDANGNAFIVTTDSGFGSRTHLTHIGPGGQIQTDTVDRAPYYGQGLVHDASGTVYQLTVDRNSQQTYVTMMTAAGVITRSAPLQGTPADLQALVVAPDGTVYVTTQSGNQTYLATVATDGTTATSNAQSGYATTGVVVANGTVYQATSTATSLVDPSGWTLHRPPAPVGLGYGSGTPASADGAVTGSVNAVDPDGAALTYALAPDSDPGVSLNPDGTFTFTPNDDQRHVAYYGAGPTDVTFTVYVSDGEFRVPVVVKAPIGGVAGSTIVVPAGANPVGAFTVGPDGTAYQMSHDNTTNTSYVTVIGADGHAYTSGALPGGTIDTPVLGPDGRSYLVTYDGTSAYLNAIGAGGTETHVVPGQSYGLSVGADGSVYQTSFSSDPFDPFGTNAKTYVTYVGSDGALHTTAALTGMPERAVVVGADGRAYLTSNAAGKTYVTTIGADGVVGDPVELTGRSLGTVLFDGNGNRYQATYDQSASKMYVTAFGADGTPHTSAAINGYLTGGPAAATDGVVVTTSSQVTVVDSTGAIVRTATVSGSAVDNPVVDANGTVYQTGAFYDSSNYRTVVTILRPDGTTSYSPEIPGLVHYARPQVAANGTVLFFTDNRDTNGNETTLTIVDASGATTIVHGIPGLSQGEKSYVAADGTVYVQTSTYSGGRFSQTHLTVIAPNGAMHTDTVARAPYYGQGLMADANGTVYQLTVDEAAQTSYLTAIGTNGVVTHSAALQGIPAGQRAVVVTDDGTVFVTTQSNYSTTYVATVGADGTTRVSDPRSGYAQTGVVMADGKLYQSTSAGTSVVDPSGWQTV